MTGHAAFDVDLAVVGGGVVGLSVACEAAVTGRSVVLLERESRFGEQQSTHNSMVIHAGLYYPPGSLKARLCVEGRRELVRRLAEWGVPHRIVGKLVVAQTGEEEERLTDLARNAAECGVASCRIVDASELRAIEPAALGCAALVSPETGILDAGGYVQSLAARAEAAGALLLTGAEVVGLRPSGDSIEVETAVRGRTRARVVVNAAGLYADEVARMAGTDGYTIHPCRGEYAAVVPRRQDVVRGLVYPLPYMDNHGLGVHATRTVFGELWIGPTSRFIESKTDYESGRLPLSAFAEAVGRLVAGIAEADLRLGQSGIRAKRVPAGSLPADFLIEPDARARNLIHLVGIESPGLTASPAIGRHVFEMARAFL